MNNFLTAEELAELEADLGDLEGLDAEPEPKAEPKPKVETPKAKAKPAEKAAVAVESVDAGEDDMAELEAELNALDEPATVETAETAVPITEFATVEESQQADEALAQELAEDAEIEQQKEQAAAMAEKVERQAREEQTARAAKVAEAVEASTPEGVVTAAPVSAGVNQPLVDPDQLRKDLAFSTHNVTDAFMRQAGMFAHYGVQSAKAERELDRLEQQEKLVYATLDQAVREEANHSGEKITEAAIKNRVLLDPRHRKIVDRKLDAKAVASMAKIASESFRQRRDMLIQVGADLREEFKGDMRMKAAQDSRDSLKDRAMGALERAKSQ